MAYGSRTITINGTAYIVNNIRISRPVTEALDRDTLGSPARARRTHDLSSLSGELQLATSATTRPKFGDTWSMTVDSNYGSETWVLDPVEYEEDNGPGNIRSVSISAKKVLVAITTVGTDIA